MQRKKTIDAAIGERLQQVRIMRRLSQRELARRLSVTTRMVRYYEQGNISLTVDRITQCAVALDCDPASLLVDKALQDWSGGGRGIVGEGN